MSDYTFETLNDKEFEILCCDLLSEVEGKSVERFKPGKDQGVDGRFFSSDGLEIIVQVKHWPNASFTTFHNQIKNIELPKINKLNPKRYILATSLPLSRHNKQTLLKTLFPYIYSENDILGRECLNTLISKFKSVEIKHYKLWLSSSNVLSMFLNKSIFDRSSASSDEIQQKIRMYVETHKHQEAVLKLDNFGVIIISGEPGIGKTTLAEQLCLQYISKGYQYYKIENSVQEAEEFLNDHNKSLFYYDDFLGRNYLDALHAREDSSIISFIKRVRRNVSKRFILTSRSTILNQGYQLYDIFNIEKIPHNEFRLDISQLSNLEKAKILYNHIWHSGIKKEYVDELYKDKRYFQIIKHANFNPRLISMVTDPDRLDEIPSKTYWDYFTNSLQNPITVWENPFDAQLDDFGRLIVLMVTLNAKEIGQNELSEAYARCLSRTDTSTFQGRREFMTNLKHLTGSFLNRKISHAAFENAQINLFNPSIGDYVINRYSQDLLSLYTALICLRSLASIESIESMKKSKVISEMTTNSLFRKLLREIRDQKFKDFSIQYITNFCAIYIDLKIAPEELNDFIPFVLQLIQSSDISDCIYAATNTIIYAIEIKLMQNQNIIAYINKTLEYSLEENCLDLLCDIIADIPTYEDGYLETKDKLCGALLETLGSNFSTKIQESDIFSGLDPDEFFRAEDKIFDLAQSILEKYNFEFPDDAIDEILQEVDSHAEFEAYIDSIRDTYYESPKRGTIYNPDSEIDDLFER